MQSLFCKIYMCDYSKGILERGIERGIMTSVENSIRNLMDSMNWTAEQAMTALKIPEQQREQYRKKIKEKIVYF